MTVSTSKGVPECRVASFLTALVKPKPRDGSFGLYEGQVVIKKIDSQPEVSFSDGCLKEDTRWCGVNEGADGWYFEVV